MQRHFTLPVAIVAWFSPFLRPAAVASEPPREFSVMVYNAEMLFDIDGVAALEDFRPERWGPAQLDRKIAGISQVLGRVDGGRGPDVVCFNEFEADQTPETSEPDLPRCHKTAGFR